MHSKTIYRGPSWLICPGGPRTRKSHCFHTTLFTSMPSVLRVNHTMMCRVRMEWSPFFYAGYSLLNRAKKLPYLYQFVMFDGIDGDVYSFTDDNSNKLACFIIIALHYAVEHKCDRIISWSYVGLLNLHLSHIKLRTVIITFSTTVQ